MSGTVSAVFDRWLCYQHLPSDNDLLAAGYASLLLPRRRRALGFVFLPTQCPRSRIPRRRSLTGRVSRTEVGSEQPKPVLELGDDDQDYAIARR